LLELNTLYNVDCLTGMKDIDDHTIDFILADLPYQTTCNHWDSMIPLDELWTHYKRLLKPAGVIALTATQPFTTTLIHSNMADFRYEWIWQKNQPTGHLNAHRRPMRVHESILMFAPDAEHTYNPQDLVPFQKIKRRGHNGTNFGKSGAENYQEWTNYPRSILDKDFAPKENRFHPTQKPLSLFNYLVLTYTKPGELVLDNCMGSGTTAVACLLNDRKYIGFETDTDYFDKALIRIHERESERTRAASLDDLFVST
jgi:site-specific DNA-methyltransferase (adenine-specific)